MQLVAAESLTLIISNIGPRKQCYKLGYLRSLLY